MVGRASRGSTPVNPGTGGGNDTVSPSPEKNDTVPEGKHIELKLPKLNPDGSDCMAKLYYPKNAVSYNSMQHVSAETSVPEKQKKKKCADIDTAVTGLPAMVTPEQAP